MPIAEQKDKEISELVTEALRKYLWEAKERKIEREMEAYRTLHAELKQRFLGKYAAIHNGELVDHDTDRRALSQRVRKKYGNAAALGRRRCTTCAWRSLRSWRCRWRKSRNESQSS